MGGEPPASSVLAGLGLALDGWAPFLHPRFVDFLRQGLTGEDLYAPDYRKAALPSRRTALPDRGQAVALPVVMLETLAAELSLAEVVARSAADLQDPKRLDSPDRLLQLVPVIVPLALELSGRAHAHAEGAQLPPPAWAGRMDAAQRAVASALRRYLATTRAVRGGSSGLLFDERELPLYFMGDELRASSRFLAISDYLLGSGPSSTAWAPALVAQAQQSLQTARAAWTQQMQRRLLDQQSAVEQAEREDALRRSYGTQVLALCGNQEGLSPVDVLEPSTVLHPASCFVRHELPGCGFDPGAWVRALTPDDVALQVCLVGTLKERVGSLARFGAQDFDALAAQHRDCSGPELFPDGCTETGGEPCFRCTVAGTPLAARLTPSALGSARISGVSLETLESVEAECVQRFPAGRHPLPSPELQQPKPVDRAACYRGALGESALTLRGLAQDIEIARSRLADLSDAYDLRLRSCVIQQLGNQRMEALTASHNSTMSKLRKGKLAADVTANAAGAVKDCASTAAGDATFGVASGVTCGAAAVEAVAQSVSDGLQFAMDEATVAHEALMAEIQNDISEQVCFNDAEIELVGARTAALEISRAALELEVGLVRFFNLQDEVKGLLDEGRAALAARAVEYELQQSLPEKAEVLSAQSPAQLDAALDASGSSPPAGASEAARPRN